MQNQTPEARLAGARQVHRSQRQSHIEPINDPLHVVTMYSNPERWRSRQELFFGFAKHVEDSGAILHVIELALRDRHFEVTEHGNPNHIQRTVTSQIWSKEDALNAAIRSLPFDARYVAWIDADVLFTRPDWATETVHQLQHFEIVQMFSHAQDVGPQRDLGPDQKLAGAHQSFMCSYRSGVDLRTWRPVGKTLPYPYGKHKMWHTGYAWAARRSALNDLGLLGDISILGSADHHMAAALIGEVDCTIHVDMQPSYRAYWRQWQKLAIEKIRFNVGFVPGLLIHNWHGAKVNRRYVDRWKVLTEENFDHLIDLKRDFQGFWELTERNHRLRDRIRDYFRERNEDSIDL